MSGTALKRRREALAKARAVLAAKRKKAKVHRQPKRDWGAIIAKRNATIARRNAEMAIERAAPSPPMAAAQ